MTSRQWFDLMEPAVWGVVLTFVLVAIEEKAGWNAWWLVKPLWLFVGLLMLLVYLNSR